MIGKHLWDHPGPWRAGELRRCLKCLATVKLVTVPRFRSRIFCTMTRTGAITTGAMTRCRP